MKPFLLTTLALGVFTLSSLGQGTFSLNNSASTLVLTTTVYGTNAPASSSLDAKIEILWAPVGTTDYNLFQLVPGAVVNVGVPSAGRFSGGTRTIPAGSGYTGIAPGDTVAALFRGWTGPATSWNQFQNSGWNGLLGFSSVFTIDTGDPTMTPAGTPASIYSSTATPFSGMVIGWIPEPSSAALLLLSCGLLGWRRLRSAH